MRAWRILAAALAFTALSSSVAVADGPDLTVEYDGWVPELPNIIKFVVRNNGDAPSEKTTGKGQTTTPAPPQETAPPIPALDPGETFDVFYSVWPADDCQNHIVRLSVPLADDADPDDNTLDAQICDTTEGADLKLEYLGIQAGRQTVKFRVTNVGLEETEAITGKIENLSDPATSPFTPSIPALDPGAIYEITYAFGGCKGDLLEMRASIPLESDRYPINNSHYEQVCKMIVAPEPAPVPVGPAPQQTHNPVTLTFNGIVQGNPRAQAPDPACSEIAVANRPRTVGFQNSDDTPGGCVWRQYWRLLFKFDLSELRGRNYTISNAALDFDEDVYLDRDANGQRPDYGPRFVATCGLKLGRPVADWTRFGARFGFEPLGENAASGGFKGLTDAVSRMVADPQVETQGLVLVGPNEALTPNRAACMSQISNLSLSVTYVP